MKFNSAVEAQAAREQLLRSGLAESVAPNFLYHLAIHLQAQDAEEGATFLGLPFVNGNLFSAFDGTIPEVELPSGNVTAGVDPLAAKDWALNSIKMPSVEAVQSMQSGQQPLTAAVIDTGVDYNHEDLIGAMWRDSSNPELVGYDFAHNVDKPFDVRHFDMAGCLKDKTCTSGETQNKFLTNPGHGTHCAGHVGAVANNSIGIRGIGGNVRVMALKFFYDDTDGDNAGQATMRLLSSPSITRSLTA